MLKPTTLYAYILSLKTRSVARNTMHKLNKLFFITWLFLLGNTECFCRRCPQRRRARAPLVLGLSSCRTRSEIRIRLCGAVCNYSRTLKLQHARTVCVSTYPSPANARPRPESQWSGGYCRLY